MGIREGREGSREADLGWGFGVGVLSSDRRQGGEVGIFRCIIPPALIYPESLDPGPRWSQGDFQCVELRVGRGKGCCLHLGRRN